MTTPQQQQIPTSTRSSNFPSLISKNGSISNGGFGAFNQTGISSNNEKENINGCGAFQAFPNKIVFKDFEAPGSYKETISFRNNDNVSIRIIVD